MPNDSILTPPHIEISISGDKMAASVTILPPAQNASAIDADVIFSKLNELQIVTGVEESKIHAIVTRYNQTKSRIESEEIAKGRLPKPGKKGEIQLLVSGITDKAHYDAIISESENPHITDVLRHNNRVKRVNIGDTFARRQPNKKGTAGEDIYGHPIESTEYIGGEEQLGEHAEWVEDGSAVRSKSVGIAALVGNKVSVIPVEFNGQFALKISPDRMVATGTLLPAGEGGVAVNAAAVSAALTSNKIVYGINQPAIQDALNKTINEKTPLTDIPVAIGTQPIHGANGRIEYHFQAEGSLKPKTMEDGSVNFKELALIETVSEGQELARMFPPSKGQPGHDVMGNIVPARDGTPINLPAGTNTGPHPQNPEILIALKAGNVRLSGNLVEVSEGFVINGCVDFSTGNVDYAQSVTVKEDIKGGFSVHTGADLEVGGLVEDCNLEINGNLLIKGGFVGSGKGEIVAGGTVNVGFIRNQTIKSRNSIVVAKEAMNARLMARNSISIHGKTLSAVGGKISARNEIEGFVFGNEQGTRTEIEVGMDFTLLEEKFKAEEKIRELSENRKKVNENLVKFEKIQKIKKALPPKQEFLYKKLLALSSKIDSQMAALEKRKEMIDKKIQEIGKAKIIVKDRLFPGVQIKIGDRHMTIQETVLGPKTVTLVDGEIRFL